MPNFANSPSAMADISGRHLHDHKLVHDTPAGFHRSEQRTCSDDTAQGSTNHTGGRGSGQSTSEEAVNEDDDEDSSGNQDDQDDQDDDPEALAPSRGKGLGKGKRPTICIDHVDEDESHDEEEEEEDVSHETGLKAGKNPAKHALMRTKKRTLSNVSNSSVLFGEADAEQEAFPRSKMARTLSSNNLKPLLTYKNNGEAKDSNSFENAIESSDDEKDIDIDDEDYSGVNMISDESDVEQQDEDYLITQQRHLEFDMINNPRRYSLESVESEDYFGFNGAVPESFFNSTSFPDVGFGQFFEPVPMPAPEEAKIDRKYSTGSSKRVRFEDPVQVSDSSSSPASSLDSSVWPDLFMEQEKLPASIYQMMENENETDNVDDFPSSGSEHSFWDNGQDDSRGQMPPVEKEYDDLSDSDSSGYETDLGDTTDEDEPVYFSDVPKQPPHTPRQATVLRRPSSAPGSKAASPTPFQRSKTTANGKVIIPPLRGVFIHDETSQAIAVTNRATKALTFYRPRVPLAVRQPNYAAYSSTTSTANNSPRTSLTQFNASDSEVSNDVFINPFQNSDIMLTGIFGSAPASNYLFGGDSVGPPEAFFPFVSIEQNGNVYCDEDEDEYDDYDYENDLQITDFMDFGDDASDVEQYDETDVPATPATSMVAFTGSTPAAFPGSTPAQSTPIGETPTRKRNASDAMLEHFDRGVVTAFRNNQTRYRDLASLPHDPDLRASVSRPIRSGKTADSFMTPIRKRSSASRKVDNKYAGVTKASNRLQSSLHSSPLGSRRGPPMGTFS
ncbi:hypothetical protein EJ04DRAFT_223015 [Polyplosphaeria fusca]|uniref:Uncharacterized protein n=1 Tax=Polyplosphaeria fusca TaxID=682080 RepID=A0A9P4R1N9_9PLEO|nr:hypothetical protein EJ04DRAFT_223015 [Polyplosphaeria fusca]